MNTRVIPSIFGSCSLILFASSAFAQQRTFVSGLGSDSNPCTRAAPCRTFGQAISQTNPGGEVYVLDSAGYGAFTINKAVSIVTPQGVTAGVSVFSGDGITINAGGSDTVVLRGLTVNNQGSSGSGIVFNSGGTLHVENCVINGFSTTNSGGLEFLGAGTLEVKDSIMRGNDIGILVKPSPGLARATIDQVRLEGGSTGLLALSGSGVAVRNSVASASAFGFAADSVGADPVQLRLERCLAFNNRRFGIVGSSGSTGTADVDIEGCVVSDNTIGVLVESFSTGVATVRLSNSTVTGNGTGIDNLGSPAIFLSRGNNTVEGNTANTSGTIGSYSAK